MPLLPCSLSCLSERTAVAAPFARLHRLTDGSGSAVLGYSSGKKELPSWNLPLPGPSWEISLPCCVLQSIIPVVL